MYRGAFHKGFVEHFASDDLSEQGCLPGIAGADGVGDGEHDEGGGVFAGHVTGGADGVGFRGKALFRFGFAAGMGGGAGDHPECHADHPWCLAQIG